jgi:hypothetical protein
MVFKIFKGYEIGLVLELVLRDEAIEGGNTKINKARKYIL